VLRNPTVTFHGDIPKIRFGISHDMVVQTAQYGKTEFHQYMHARSPITCIQITSNALYKCDTPHV
jgi:hypothetical protein